ncbi:MAG: hypothetical protein ACPL1F_01425, partial [bacterium]
QVVIHKNFYQLGFIPSPTLDIDYAYLQPCCALYLSPYSTRTIEIQYASEKDIYCKGGRLEIWVFRKGYSGPCLGYGDMCSGVVDYPDFIGFLECVVNQPQEVWSSYRVYGYSLSKCGYWDIQLKLYWKNIGLPYVCP